jgi:hypothetical protein
MKPGPTTARNIIKRTFHIFVFDGINTAPVWIRFLHRNIQNKRPSGEAQGSRVEITVEPPERAELIVLLPGRSG